MKTTQQLTHFVYQICSAISAVAVVFSLSSVAQAQTAFPDRYRDVIDFRRAGVSDAMVEVACEHGDQKLVDAVYKENRIKPQFILNDDGTRTCLLPGGCSDRGETGQLPQRCESKRTDVKWFGDRDVRNDADAFVTSAKDKAAYSGVGRIQCRGKKAVKDGKGKTVIQNVTFSTTAFHVGSFDTVVTNAHTFVEDRINPTTGAVESVKLSHDNCAAVFYNQDGTAENISIAFVDSRWDKPGLFEDRSQDIAIVKLVRESKFPSSRLGYEYGYGHNVVENLPVSMVGYHNDVVDPHLIRKTSGQVHSAPPGFYAQRTSEAKSLPFTNMQNVFVGDYPSNHGSSGSPILNAKGNVIGIHQGQADESGNRTFDKKKNYNMGIFFDEQFNKDIQRIKAMSVSA